MRNLILVLLIGLLTFSCFIGEAQAKRFGGGKSFGVTRNMSSAPRSAPHAAPASAAKPASSASKWLGPLAGFAAGTLLASLFMGHGVGGGLLSWLLIGALAFFIWRFIRARMPSFNQTNNNNYQREPAANNFFNATFPGQESPQTVSASATPGVFVNNNAIPSFNGNQAVVSSMASSDTAAILRQAKALFIRMQTAYDYKNLNDIREFTTPEVYAEVQLQLQERGNASNQTEVINIDAQMLDQDFDLPAATISVLFSGLIREEPGAEPIAIREIWQLQKNTYANNWLVAGIQQEQ